jgi:hypothetical protein
MVNSNKVQLEDMKKNLQAQLHYKNPDYAFDILLYGWAKKTKRAANWLSLIKKRGWVSLNMALEIQHYCGYKIL